MPAEDLEKYLTEPSALADEVPAIKEAMEDYKKKIDSIENFEKVTSELVKGIKDPRSHNPGGVTNLYGLYKAALETYAKQEEEIGEGYELRIGDVIVAVTPQNTLNVWNYRLDWAKIALEGLFHIYKSEMTKVIEESQKLQDEIKETLGS